MENDKFKDKERQNIEVVKEWVRCWNTPGLGERMVDVVYADPCEVFTPLQNLYYTKLNSSKEKWRRIEKRADQAYQERRMDIITLVPHDNLIALEAKVKTVTLEGEISERWFAAFLTIKNGKIVIDHTYHKDPLPLEQLRDYLAELQ